MSKWKFFSYGRKDLLYQILSVQITVDYKRLCLNCTCLSIFGVSLGGNIFYKRPDPNFSTKYIFPYIIVPRTRISILYVTVQCFLLPKIETALKQFLTFRSNLYDFFALTLFLELNLLDKIFQYYLRPKLGCTNV